MGRARGLIAHRIGAATLVLLVACSSTSGTVRGPVTSVEGDLSEVNAFSVLVDGDEWRFLPVEDGDYAFPLQHLGEHRRNGDLVLIGWELRDDVRYALSVEDG